ncbi:MAG: TonB-dependent receptor [Bacteroidota bacterium]
MKSQLTLKKALITLLFVLASAAVFAQGTGKISGTITDRKTGEPIIGVTVKIAGAKTGIGSDVDGKYLLGGLAEGKYILEVSYISYLTKKITDIEVKPNTTTSLNITMEESAQTLNQVVITASFKQESINSLYAQQKNSASISDGISSESIKRSPDKNTSDVLKRVSGASIQDNKFVVIRGLSDRYNTALLDHAELPSTEPNRKAFSFDIVPSSLVDNIIINKTATPDLPGNFTGGAIQIITKDVPDNDYLSIGIGTGYNSVSTANNFMSGPRSGINYLGFDGGNRNLTANFPSSSAISGGLNTNQNTAAIKTLPNDWNKYAINALPTQNYQVTLGRVKNFDNNKKLGAIVALTYRNSQSITPALTRDFHVYDFVDNQFKFSTSLGALANFAYNYGNSKITFKNIYNKVYDDNFLSREGTDVSRGDIRFYAFDLLQKTLFKSTVEGNHKISDKNDKLNWSLSFDDVLNDQPDQRKVEYFRNIADRNDPNGFRASITGLGKANTRLFSKMHENGYAGTVNYIRPLTMFSKNAILKTGLSSQYRDRNFDVRFIGLVLNTNDPIEANEIRSRPLQTLFGNDLINAGKYRLDEIANAGDKYTANSFNNAAYAMLDNKLGAKWRVVWGVRAEQSTTNLTTFSTLIDPVKQNYFDILPSANFTYSVTPKSNLRASYSRTLARPELRELAPFQYYDYELLAIQAGNTNLKRALIDNLDFRYEFYPSAGQILSVSVFYKKFNNAIESYIDDVNSTPIISYFNSKKASTYGIEFEGRKTLDFINPAGFFKNTIIYANVALIKSAVENPNNPQLLEKDRPMVGQAPYVINAGIQHNLLANKMGINLLYNRVGRKIYKAGGQQFPSVWENPRDVLDFQLSYKVSKTAELKLNAGDILNQRNVLYFDKDNSKSYNPVAKSVSTSTNDQTISSYKAGSNYSLSFSYNF